MVEVPYHIKGQLMKEMNGFAAAALLLPYQEQKLHKRRDAYLIPMYKAKLYKNYQQGQRTQIF